MLSDKLGNFKLVQLSEGSTTFSKHLHITYTTSASTRRSKSIDAEDLRSGLQRHVQLVLAGGVRSLGSPDAVANPAQKAPDHNHPWGSAWSERAVEFS